MLIICLLQCSRCLKFIFLEWLPFEDFQEKKTQLPCWEPVKKKQLSLSVNISSSKHIIIRYTRSTWITRLTSGLDSSGIQLILSAMFLVSLSHRQCAEWVLISRSWSISDLPILLFLVSVPVQLKLYVRNN